MKRTDSRQFQASFTNGSAGRARARRCLLPLLSVGLLGACDKPKPDDSQEPEEKTVVEPEVATATPVCDAVDFTSSSVPTTYSGTWPANGADLAAFAWQHFVALNWQSANRGQPNTSKTFFENPTLPVWLSYRHRNEQFPASGAPNADYNAAPVYNYTNVSGPCDSATDTDPNAINNLDEASQLGLDYMFANPDKTGEIQILFEAKVNEANYTYILNNKLYEFDNQTKYNYVNTGQTKKTDPVDPAVLAKYGGLCQTPHPNMCAQDVSSSKTAGYCLPCNDASGNEGTIHVKAAWRKLTDTEVQSGHFFTAPVVLYKPKPTKKKPNNVCYTNATGETWGLVGLHIIHKTEQFPTFMFATWEHVENETSNLSFENTNTGGPAATVGNKLPWARASHEGQSLPSADVEAFNACVQGEIAQNNADSVWQYYQLVGVQGTPVDYATPPTAQTDLPDFYLANNVIESNDFFQSFIGSSGQYSADPPPATGPDGTTIGPNLAIDGNTNINDGGCQGCHGNAQRTGFDMSFLGATFANTADAIGEFKHISPNNARFQSIGANH